MLFFKENIKPKNILLTIVVILLVIFIIQIKSIALLFFGSYVIACSLNPLVDKLSKKMPRALASSLVLGCIFIMGLLFLIPIVSITCNEIEALMNSLPARIDKLIEYLSTTDILGQNAMDLINIEGFFGNTSQIATDIVNKSINITVALAEGITIFLTVGMIVFYLIYEKSVIKHGTLRLFPRKARRRALTVMTTIEEKVGGYVIAQGLSMATVALVTAIGLSIIKVDYAILLAIIAGVLDIIPIVGPTIALTLGIIAASAHGAIWILPTIAIYLIAQWISNNFVRPLVFGKFLNMHPLWVIFSFLVAAQFLGVWGVILAPAIAALIATLFDEFYIKVINGEKENLI